MYNAQDPFHGKRVGNFVDTGRNQKDSPLVADVFDLAGCTGELSPANGASVEIQKATAPQR